MFIERPLNSNSIRNKGVLFGVGVNDADYIVQLKKKGDAKRSACPFYRAWCDMLKRCYCVNSRKRCPTYSNCTVNKEWHLFSNFRSWMKTQNWKGKCLDKDLLIYGNKVYGAEGCYFVTPEVNSVIISSSRAGSIFPVGVSLHKSKGKIRATCNQYGKHKHIGYFSSPIKASRAYKEFKSNHIRMFAERYKDDAKVFRSLITHANYMLREEQK
tara:strand:- start:25 stop:663 length:639 start_codon:yes stop_codon:yes gene_type:complete